MSKIQVVDRNAPVFLISFNCLRVRRVLQSVWKTVSQTLLFLVKPQVGENLFAICGPILLSSNIFTSIVVITPS